MFVSFHVINEGEKTMENVMPLEIVRNGFIPPLSNPDLKKEKELRNVCAEMIRKDIELLVLQHKLQDIFHSCQFYSVAGDDFSSIEHTLIMASQNGFKSVDQIITENIKEEATNLILDLFERGNTSLYEINVVAIKIAKVIFDILKQEHVEFALMETQRQFSSIQQFLDREI